MADGKGETKMGEFEYDVRAELVKVLVKAGIPEDMATIEVDAWIDELIKRDVGETK